MCIFQPLSQLVFSCSQVECQKFCINELYSSHIAYVKPSLINSLSSLNQCNALLTILSKQLLFRESLEQYIILWCWYWNFICWKVTDFYIWHITIINYSACPQYDIMVLCILRCILLTAWFVFPFLLRDGQDYIHVLWHRIYHLTPQPDKDCVIHSEHSPRSFHSQKSSFQDMSYQQVLFQVVTRAVNYCDIQLLLQCLPSRKCLARA